MTARIPLYLDGGTPTVMPPGDTVDDSRLNLTDYLKLSGRAGGQTAYGGTASGNNLTLGSTAHATKGKIFLGANSAYDEVNIRLGLGTTSPSNQLELTKSMQLVDTAASDEGVIYKGGSRFLHNYSNPDTVAGFNTFCGINSGNFTMTGATGFEGTSLSAFGRDTLKLNTTGQGSSAFGLSSLESNTTGNYNTAIGFASLFLNTSGSENSAFGRNALSGNQTGSYNTAVGASSLPDCNTAATTGANTAIGYNTGAGITTGTDNTILGANVTGLSSTLTGNIILSDGSGNIKYRYDGTDTTITGGLRSDTGFSIGAVSTEANKIKSVGALTIQPAAGSNLNVTLSGTGDFAVNTNQIYVDTSAGKVGFGTSTPTDAVEVYGATPLVYVTATGVFSGFVFLNNGGATKQVTLVANNSGRADFRAEIFSFSTYNASAEYCRITNTPNLCLGVTTTGTGATYNLVIGGGSTSPVLGAASADKVHIGAVDNGAGNREVQFQPEAGSFCAFGNNRFRIPQGGSASKAHVGGVTFDHFADAGNTGTGEDDLYSDSIPASTFAVNGDKTVAVYQGIFTGAAASTQQLRAYFGGTKIYDSGALAIGVATNHWTLRVVCIRVSSSVVRCSASLSTDFGTVFPYSTYTEVTGLTLTNAQILKITGEAAGAGAANNQIVAKLSCAEYLPSAA